MKENNESMGTNQELTNSSENIYGLKSYTDGREMWKVMTSKWSDEEVNQAQILNDSRFEKTLAIRILEKMLLKCLYGQGLPVGLCLHWRRFLQFCLIQKSVKNKKAS